MMPESPIPTSSTSKCKVALPGMTLSIPRGPYPSDGGMMSERFPPTRIVASPWSLRGTERGGACVKPDGVPLRFARALTLTSL